MTNRVIASLALALILSLVLLDLTSADAGVDVPDKAGTALVALPHEYVFKSEITTTDVVLPLGNLELLRSSPVHDHEKSEMEDQNSKRDDENEAWLEVETEPLVGVVQSSDSNSDPFSVIRLGHRQHNCRHKPWFRELRHNENEYGYDESFSKDSGEDASLDLMILGVMHLEQGHGHANWKKHSSVPHRGGVANIPGVRSFKRLDDQESVEEKTDQRQEKEDENSEKEARKEHKEKEVEKTETEPKDVKTETKAKEEKAENREKEEETDSNEKEQKEETMAKENLEKETTDKQVQIWLNRFRKFMNF